MCRNKQGIHYLCEKSRAATEEKLLFSIDDLAQQYINTLVDGENYQVSYILYRNDCVPNNVITEREEV
jgi:hypothetical protein